VAAIFAVLPPATWLVSLVMPVLFRRPIGGATGWHMIISHPLGLVMGALTAAAYLFAAWLLEEDNWVGAVLAGAMFLRAALATVARNDWHPSLQLVADLVAVGFCLAALRLLRRDKLAAV
jgi:hypothetical protein